MLYFICEYRQRECALEKMHNVLEFIVGKLSVWRCCRLQTSENILCYYLIE